MQQLLNLDKDSTLFWLFLREQLDLTFISSKICDLVRGYFSDISFDSDLDIVTNTRKSYLEIYPVKETLNLEQDDFPYIVDIIGLNKDLCQNIDHGKYSLLIRTNFYGQKVSEEHKFVSDIDKNKRLDTRFVYYYTESGNIKSISRTCSTRKGSSSIECSYRSDEKGASIDKLILKGYDYTVEYHFNKKGNKISVEIVSMPDDGNDYSVYDISIHVWNIFGFKQYTEVFKKKNGIPGHHPSFKNRHLYK